MGVIKKSKRLVVTGYSSKIAMELNDVIRARGIQVQLIKVGRGKDADIKVDFSKLSDTHGFVNWIKDNSPTHLLLNHGVLPGTRLADTTEAVVQDCLQVNLVSYALIIESLESVKKLRTVVMSSISGKAGSFDTLYAACKAGVDVTVRRIAASIPPSSRLNAVSPGIIHDARMTIVRRDIRALESKRLQTPTRKFTSSHDVAQLLHYLLFQGENISGENINVNGGIYIP